MFSWPATDLTIVLQPKRKFFLTPSQSADVELFD
jgi:hypothetical protein